MKAPYAEGGSALRHYSLCIFNLRVVTVAQGLVLVTGSTLLLKDSYFISAGAVSIFGILFTLALYAMQRSYWICFDSVLTSVLKIESDIAGQSGPWVAYDAAKDRAYGRLWWKILVKHGPFWLFWLGFSAIIAVAVAGQHRSV
jgi:hypothetical protein